MSFLLVTFVLSSTLTPALAQSATIPAAPDSASAQKEESWPAPIGSQQTARERLDDLFDALKRERDTDKASIIARRIWASWNDTGSATVNLLLKWSDDATRAKRDTSAFDFIDQAIVLEPESASVWSKRALLNYKLGNNRRAMSDLNRVLQREPRHFGALAVMADILENAGKTEAALATWKRYLDIYPADKDAQEKVVTLSEKLAGNRA